MSGPLAGVVVLEFGQALAGPLAGMLLGDMGADVIKVEPPGGDMLRDSGPFVSGDSQYFQSTNRNKRSIVLDLRSPESAPALDRLLRTADVVIENFRPGVAERLGISFVDVRAVNPDVVYLSITAYGAQGPRARWPGFDQVAQGLAGIMSVTGIGEPTRTGIPVTDVLAGLYGTAGILAALLRRGETGRGGKVETSLLASGVASLGVLGQQYLSGGAVPGLAGNDHPVLYPYGAFRAADGMINVAVAHDVMWRRLCAAIGRDDLAGDDRYATNERRVAHRDELREELNRVFKAHGRDRWVSRLNDAGVPCGPIHGIDEVFADPQVLEQGLVRAASDGSGREHRMIGSALQFSEPDSSRWRAPPALGEHTDEILRELGLRTGDAPHPPGGEA